MNIHFITQGCRSNQSETASLKQQFLEKGWKITDTPKDANFIVINTCTVTQNGDTDTRRLIHKFTLLNPNVQLVLIGCQAQIKAGELSSYPNIFLIVGNEKKMELSTLIEQKRMHSTNDQVVVPTISTADFSQRFASIDQTRTRANLKIQDGCNQFCSYCIVPFARGTPRSRIFQNILDEARILESAGYQEIILTGINIGLYDYNDKKLIDVIQALLQFPGFKRIRISSIEPNAVSDELLNLIKTETRICNFLHIPLQSGCDTILEKMNRRYRTTEFEQLIYRISDAIPDASIGTDIIVGFPGEMDAHFKETQQFLEKMPFTYFHVFSYSDREKTKSRDFPDKITTAKKAKRSQILRALSEKKRTHFLKKLIGKTLPVLFEDHKNGIWIGTTDQLIKVKSISDTPLKNKIIPVKLITATPPFLTGELTQQKK